MLAKDEGDIQIRALVRSLSKFLLAPIARVCSGHQDAVKGPIPVKPPIRAHQAWWSFSRAWPGAKAGLGLGLGLGLA